MRDFNKSALCQKYIFRQRMKSAGLNFKLTPHNFCDKRYTVNVDQIVSISNLRRVILNSLPQSIHCNIRYFANTLCTDEGYLNC